MANLYNIYISWGILGALPNPIGCQVRSLDLQITIQVLQQFEVYHYNNFCHEKFLCYKKVFLLTKTIAKVERRIADKAFLYKELTISIIPFIICIATFAMCMKKVDKAFQILTNGFSGKFESEIPSAICLSFVI